MLELGGCYGQKHASVVRDDCISKDQSQTFSGVGAKHQNAVAERNIQTLCYWARLLYQVVNLVLYYVLLGIYIRGKGTPGMFDPVL